jgi:hypothetical protein
MLRWTRAMMWTGRISCGGLTGRCPAWASWRRSGGGRGTRTRGTSANASLYDSLSTASYGLSL